MDWEALFGFMAQRVREPDLWGLVVGVGLLINLYGQIIVPWLRKAKPLQAVASEARSRPGIFALSVFVAFLFPFVVSVLSSSVTSYASRHVHDMANFPDEKPDPVFRVDLDGNFVNVGRSTRRLLDAHPVANAVELLGADAWRAVSEAVRTGEPRDGNTFVEYAGHWYLVSHSTSSDGQLINVYLARLAGSPESMCP